MANKLNLLENKSVWCQIFARLVCRVAALNPVNRFRATLYNGQITQRYHLMTTTENQVIVRNS